MYTFRNTPLALVALLAFLAACNGDGYRNIREFYFPVLDLQQGMVYGYDLTVNGQTTEDYWYYRGFVRDSGLFFTSTNYDNLFHINQISREVIDESGAKARTYAVYEQDSADQKAIAAVTVLEGTDIFPFKVKDSLGIFLFSLNYRLPSQPAAKQYLIRNRYYLGDGPDFELEGKKYPCIRIGTREAIGTEGEGSSEIEGRGEEWYAKGIGLVYFTKIYGKNGELKREYRLKERFGMNELERRANRTIQ
jgi:hypothetical protein